MVTICMVAEFCSIVLIHNTLLGEITISSKMNYKGKLYLYSPVHIDIFPHAISLILWSLSYAS